MRDLALAVLASVLIAIALYAAGRHRSARAVPATPAALPQTVNPATETPPAAMLFAPCPLAPWQAPKQESKA